MSGQRCFASQIEHVTVRASRVLIQEADVDGSVPSVTKAARTYIMVSRQGLYLSLHCCSKDAEQDL